MVIYLASITINLILWFAGYAPISVKILFRTPSMEVFTATLIGQLISWASLICDCIFRFYLWLIMPLHIESNEIISHKTVFLLLLIHLTGVICGQVFKKFIYTGIILIVGKGLVVPIEIIISHEGVRDYFVAKMLPNFLHITSSLNHLLICLRRNWTNNVNVHPEVPTV